MLVCWTVIPRQVTDIKLLIKWLVKATIPYGLFSVVCINLDLPAAADVCLAWVARCCLISHILILFGTFINRWRGGTGESVCPIWSSPWELVHFSRSGLLCSEEKTASGNVQGHCCSWANVRMCEKKQQTFYTFLGS